MDLGCTKGVVFVENESLSNSKIYWYYLCCIGFVINSKLMLAILIT